MEEILELLEQKQHSKVKSILAEKNIADIASLFEQIEDSKQAVILFRLLDKDTSAEVFAFLEPEMQEYIISALSDKDISFIMSEMYLDDATDFIHEMPASVVSRVLKNTTKDIRDQINKLLSYPEDSAGSIMTTEFIDLKSNITVSQAFEKIKKIAADTETLDTIYVTDSTRVLLGQVTIRDLFLAESTEKLGDIMDENIISAHTHCDQEELTNIFSKYDLMTLPILDKENRLVGIVTGDDIFDVIEEETTEDFEKMAGIAPNEEPYLKTSAFTHARKRVVWLLVLSLSALVSGEIISSFESAFAVIPALVAFIPMLMGAGGNSGSQSATVVIRGLSLNEITTKQYFKVLRKEICISLMVGSVLAVVNAIITWIRYGDIMLALVIGLSLIMTIFVAKIIGGLLPILAKKVKLDPAIMAAPIITTLVDMISVAGYFTIAKLLLGI